MSMQPGPFRGPFNAPPRAAPLSAAPSRRGSSNPLMDWLDPKGARQGEVDEVRSMAMRAFQAAVQSGKPPAQAIMEVLQSEEGRELFSMGEFDFFTELAEAVGAGTPPRPETFTVGPSATVGQVSPEGVVSLGPQAPAAPTAPTEAERTVAAIISAEQAGDTRRAELFLRTLPRDTKGETSVTDALRLRAANVAKTGNALIDGLPTKQAQEAFMLGKGQDARGLTLTDLFVIGVGGDVPGNVGPNRVTPEVAKAAVQWRRENMGAEDLLASLVSGMMGGGGGRLPAPSEALPPPTIGGAGAVEARTGPQLGRKGTYNPDTGKFTWEKTGD